MFAKPEMDHLHELKDVQYYIDEMLRIQQMALYTIQFSSTFIWFSLKLWLCVDAVNFWVCVKMSGGGAVSWCTVCDVLCFRIKLFQCTVVAADLTGLHAGGGSEIVGYSRAALPNLRSATFCLYRGSEVPKTIFVNIMHINTKKKFLSPSHSWIFGVEVQEVTKDLWESKQRSLPYPP